MTLPGGSVDQLRSLLDNARELSSDMRQQRSGSQRTGRRPGPPQSKLRLRYYLLPDQSDVPVLSGNKDQELISTHHQCGYGFPGRDAKKSHSCLLSLGTEEYFQFLARLYDRPPTTRFKLFKSDKRKNLIDIHNRNEFRKFSGVVFLKIDSSFSDDEGELPPASFLHNEQNQRNDSPIQIQPNNDSTQIQPNNATPQIQPNNATPQIQPNNATPQIQPNNAPTQIQPNNATPQIQSNNATPQIQPNNAPTQIQPNNAPPQIQPNNAPTQIQPNNAPPQIQPNNAPSQMQLIQQVDLTTEDQPSPSLAARRFIIHDQDVQFATSLQIDRDRVRARREARDRLSLRSRRRRERIAEAAALAEQNRRDALDAMGPEPDDPNSIQFIFRVPDPLVSLVRRFLYSDTCLSVYSYVEASVGKSVIIRNPEGEPLERSSTTLSNAGFTRGCLFNVEEVSTDSTTDQEEEEEEETFLDAPSSPAPSVPTRVNFMEKRENVKTNLLSERIVKVTRDSLVDDLLDHYRANDGLEHHKISMEIDGEPAIDVDGVKREVFSTFFMLVFTRFFVGENDVMPQMNPEFLCSDLFVTIGRIMAHAFVLVGYFPIRICKAAVIGMITGSSSEESIMASFMRYITPIQRSVVRKVFNSSELDSTDKLTLFAMFNEFGMTRTPDRTRFMDCVKFCAETCCLYKSLGAVGKIRQGLTAYPGFWLGVTEHDISRLYDNMRPTVPDVLRRIRYKFSDDSNIAFRTAEERIKEYLEIFIEDHVGDEGLPRLLQYWTASDILVVPTLNVGFSSQEGAGRRPSVMSCTAELMLSRFFVSCEEFVQEFKCYLYSAEGQTFNSL